jgi:hypothetical protein
MATAALDRAKEEKERLQDRLARYRQKSEKGVRATMGAAITVGSAFLGSYLEGRYPENMKLIGALPLTLVAGGALLTLSAFEVGGAAQSEYIADAGKGLLAAWAAGRGGEMGREAA